MGNKPSSDSKETYSPLQDVLPDDAATSKASEDDAQSTFVERCLPTWAQELHKKFLQGRLPKKYRRAFLLLSAGGLIIDVGTDCNVISILFHNPHAQRLAWIATGTIVAPQVLIWMFLRYYGMVEFHDLIFSVTQLEFIVQIHRSWPTGEKSLGFFWYSVAEGCIEGPINSLLSMYCMLLFAEDQDPRAFFFSTFMSLISTSRAGIDLDFYGRREGSASKALRFSQRFIDGGVRVVSLALFAFVTRPPEATLDQNAAVLIWAVMGMDLLIMLALVHVVAPTYPVSSKCLFAVVLWVAAPPQCLSSIAEAEPGYRMIRLAELGLMATVGWYHVRDDNYKQFDYLRANYVVLLESFVLLLLVWLVFNLSIILKSMFGPARTLQDRKGPLAWALSSAICQDRDPVLTGLLVKELGSDMQLFTRAGNDEGVADEDADEFVSYKPANTDERGSITVLDMALQAGPFELLKESRTIQSTVDRVEASVRVLSAVVVSCDEVQLFRVTEEEKNIRGSVATKETKPDPTPLDLVVRWLLKSKTGVVNAKEDDEEAVVSGSPCCTACEATPEGWDPTKVVAYRLLKQVAADIVKRIVDIRTSKADEHVPDLEAVGIQGTADHDLLFECIKEKNDKCLKFLLDACADVFAHDTSQRTPLLAATEMAWNQGVELITNAKHQQAEYMLKVVSNCNVKDLVRRSKSWGKRKPFDHVVHLLLKNPRELDTMDDELANDMTGKIVDTVAERVSLLIGPVQLRPQSLEYFPVKGQENVTMEGVAAKIASRVKSDKVEASLTEDRSLIFDSIYRQQEKCLDLLLKARADVTTHDMRDRLERTPLHVAMALNWEPGVRLLEESAKANNENLHTKKDIHGSTPGELKAMMQRYYQSDTVAKEADEGVDEGDKKEEADTSLEGLQEV